jgi:hypothetical protein
MSDPQLTLITDTLEERDIDYWLDSGTLLGMYRDGELLGGDLDIDIGTWRSENVEPAIEAFHQRGYKMKRYCRDGDVFKYKAIPKDTGRRPIDLNLFTNKGEYARCLATLANPLEAASDYRSCIALFWRFPAFLVWKLLYDGVGLKDGLLNAKDNTDRHIDRFPLSVFYTVSRWSIPSTYFEDVTEKPYGRVPAATEEYLSFRYGDWETPDSNWSYWHDDQGLEHCQSGRNRS